MTILEEPEHADRQHPERTDGKRPLFVFRWPGWRRFWRDLGVMNVGLVLVALWFTLMRQVGVDHLIPWGVVEHAVGDKLSLSAGSGMVIAALGAIVVSLLVRETFGWGSIANFVFITFLWADLLEQVVPDLHTSTLVAQLAWVVLAVCIGALGTGIYLSVNAGAGPRDNLMLALTRLPHVNVGLARVTLEVGLVGVGLALGGSVGWVTFTHIAVAGPAVWLTFRLFKLERRNEFWGMPTASKLTTR